MSFKISVVTPTFNSEVTLRETLESVRTQDYAEWEHLVMDGGSKDGTVAMLKEYPHLIWESERDEGHYHAMNKGIARATGDVILILNADDCLRPGAFRAVAEGFAAHPEWDALFADAVYVDGEGREIYRRKEARYDYTVLRYAFDYICHHTLYVRRQTYERVGGYRHKLFKNACDYDFILRMGKAGCQVGHLDQFLVNYRYHQFGQSVDRRIAENTRRESAIIQREHGKPDGFAGRLCFVYGHARRQFQKLLFRGTADVVPAPWLMRRYMREKAEFSSNAGLDKL